MYIKSSIATLKRRKWVVVQFDRSGWSFHAGKPSSKDKKRYIKMLNWCKEHLEPNTYRGSISTANNTGYGSTEYGTTRFAFRDESIASAFMLKFK